FSRDWSSDVCSSDLELLRFDPGAHAGSVVVQLGGARAIFCKHARKILALDSLFTSLRSHGCSRRLLANGQGCRLLLELLERCGLDRKSIVKGTGAER